MIWLEESFRGRKCHTCGDIVEPGKHIVCYQGSGYYHKQMCLSCLIKVVKELDYKNE